MPNGYSQFRYSTAKNGYGHRFAYELYKGPIPAGMAVDHLCRVRSCVNPEHLDLVTQKENVRRSPVHAGARTHCPRGHPYEGDNLYVQPSTGKRTCRACQKLSRATDAAKAKSRDYMREYLRKQRADARRWRESGQ